MANSSPGLVCTHDHPDPFEIFRFGRFTNVDPVALLAHLRDPRIARHLPLLPDDPDAAFVSQLIATKEACWERDGLGHWAILHEGEYAGFGGFQREGDEWDFGLVLRPKYFRQGKDIALQAFDWARHHTQIEEVTFLLPLSRSERALQRLGARPMGISELLGISFRKWCLNLVSFQTRRALDE
ncbi:GNAT family N-acetyltransferase [Altererythrobacter sp.]|uniref:GNAT family N-acetyltransferase n=2 Tax=Altererythrobacter sp. TaxID=1872480 RepID=UPI003D0E3336